MNAKMLLATITVFLLTIGCSEKNIKVSEHETESEEVKFQYTVYTDMLELFAEADPFIIGEECNVLSHFTDLSDFKPLINAKITIKLQVNGKEIAETKESADKPGIYSFNIKPTEAGIGKLVYEISTQENKFQVIVPDITVFSTEETAHKAAEAAELSATNAAVFTKEQSWKIDFKTELPVLEPFGQVIKTTALVKSSPDNELVLIAKTNGIVKFLSSDFVVGKPVSAGSTLFSVSGSQLSVNNSSVLFAEAKNNYETAKLDYDRKKELANDKIISEKELLEAQNRFENARINYENLEQNFNREGELVKSSVNGFVSDVFVENGQYIEQGASLAKITQDNNLLLYAEIQPKYKNLLNDYSDAVMRTIGNKQVYDLKGLNGKLISFGKSTGSDNFLIPVILKIDNSEDIIPGEFVELFLKTSSSENKITLPNTALLEEQGYFFVFVQKTPELFEKREIETAETDGLRTVIANGIIEGERVVTQGAMFVKLSQATGTLDAHSGHVH